MSNIVLVDGAAASAPGREEKRVIWIVLIGVGILTAISTVLHHLLPGVLDVPLDAIREKNVPMMDYPSMIAMDVNVMVLSWLCFHHAWKRLGLYRAVIFLGGSFVFTGAEESMWILLGRYHTQVEHALGLSVLGNITVGGGTYYFTRGFLWFFETPVTACLGWFFLAYSCVYAADLIMPKARIVTKATVGGLLAVNVDLWLDPVQTSKAFISWVWEAPDAINIFSIPLSNFVGWFLLIFLFAIVFEKLPDMVRRWGAGKATVYFYGILMVFEIFILAFFITYGSVARMVFSKPINFTLWGI